MCTHALAPQDELDTWDPRLEDYLGWGKEQRGNKWTPPFLYIGPPGAGRVTGQRPRGLYIKNLPSNMTSDSVTRLFSEYGKVESVVMGRPGQNASQPRWAIVNPHTTRDAASMLVALNGRKPLCLDISPAIKPEEKKQHQREKEEQRRFLEEVKRKVQTVRFNPKTALKNVDRGTITTIKSGYCSTSTSAPMSATTSACTTATTSTTNTTPAITTTAPSVTIAHQEISEIPFEIRCGVVMVEYRPAEPCVWCGAAGQMVCGGCGVWYCKMLCQASHWPHHTFNCSQQ